MRVVLIFARKKSRAAGGGMGLAPGRFPSAGDQRTNDTRFPRRPRAPATAMLRIYRQLQTTRTPSATLAPGSRLMSYSRARGKKNREITAR